MPAGPYTHDTSHFSATGRTERGPRRRRPLEDLLAEQVPANARRTPPDRLEGGTTAWRICASSAQLPCGHPYLVQGRCSAPDRTVT